MNNTTSSLPPTESSSEKPFNIADFILGLGTAMAIVAVFLLGVISVGFWVYFRQVPNATSPTAVAPSEGEMTAVAPSEVEMTDVVQNDMTFMYQPLNAFERLNG